MAGTPESSRKKQRVDRRSARPVRTINTRSRSQSITQPTNGLSGQRKTRASILGKRSLDRSSPEIIDEASDIDEDDDEESLGDIILTSRLIRQIKSEKELVDKLSQVFADPCTLARSFPQTNQELAAQCPVDIADVEDAYAYMFASKSSGMLEDLRLWTLGAVSMLSAEPCQEHDNQINAILILLLNPQITEYTHSDGAPLFPDLCSSIVSQPAAQQAILVQYFAAKGPEEDTAMSGLPGDEKVRDNTRFLQFVDIFQSYITRETTKAARRSPPPPPPANPNDPVPAATQRVNLYALRSTSIQVVIQCLALLNAYNQKHHLVDYTRFYNDSINEFIDIKEDFPRHRMPDGISFCTYPFLLSPTTKSEIIKIESVIMMRTELQDSFFRAMFTGVTCPYLVLEVRRDSLVRDTLYQLDLKMSQDLRKQLKVRFVGEEGVDEGGVQKEFFQLIVRDVFSVKYGIFTANDESHYFWFTPGSDPSKDALEEMRLTGLLIGLAVYNAVILDIHLPPAMYKKLLGVPVTRQDLKQFDPTLYRGLMQLYRLSGEELEFLERTFEVEYEEFGELRTHELVPGGAAIPLTVANRDQFIEKYVDFVFNVSCSKQFAEFKAGFDRICGSSFVRCMRPEELELLVCGSSDLDFGALENSTIYDGGYSKDTPVIQFFWRTVRGFSDELKRKLLFFATSSDRVPIGGLSKLHFVIAKNGGDSDRLPTSHTCFNVLLLPEYKTVEKLRERLLTAIHNSEGFGMI